jgi:hypothetical protein
VFLPLRGPRIHAPTPRCSPWPRPLPNSAQVLCVTQTMFEREGSGSTVPGVFTEQGATAKQQARAEAAKLEGGFGGHGVVFGIALVDAVSRHMVAALVHTGPAAVARSPGGLAICRIKRTHLGLRVSIEAAAIEAELSGHEDGAGAQQAACGGADTAAGRASRACLAVGCVTLWQQGSGTRPRVPQSCTKTLVVLLMIR